MESVPHSDFLLQQLNKQRERGQLCDCTVIIGQERYAAHHNVLAAFSEYFSTQCIDAGREDATITLDPEWVSSSMFEKLLDYMYTGKLTIDSEEIPSIQKAASYLGIQEVIANCNPSDLADAPAEYVDPRSPLSPDDYEPLEPIEEVEERQRLMKLEEEERQKHGTPASPEESQSSGEQTPRGSEKRIRKPKTRLYEDADFSRKESPVTPRGRGRGRGRPRGRPRTMSSGSDKMDLARADKSPSTGTEVARRGRGRGRSSTRGRPRAGPGPLEDPANDEADRSPTPLSRGSGRPRGRPRTRPRSSEPADSTSAEESVAVGKEEEPENPEGDTERLLEEPEEDGDRTKSEEAAVAKRGRGRPRIKHDAPDLNASEDASGLTNIKDEEYIAPKKGRPRSKNPPSEIPGAELSEEQDEGQDQENRKTLVSSSETADEGNAKDADEGSDPSAPPIKKVRTSSRKRCLSRKLRESQASNEENDPADEDAAATAEEWGSEDDEDEDEGEVSVSQSKHRPICNICGNLFSEMSSLRRHMRIHKGIKPYQCQLCNRCFRQGNQLKTHMRIHTGEKPFCCDRCDASFAQKCQLVYHCRMHHGEEKPHKCDACPAAFATSSNLKIHMRTHSGEKPYECSECSKRFTQASTLMYHKRRHTGEKPYICDTCGMAFAVSSSLISHNRKHTGVTPYICLDCGKPCLTSGELRKHMDIHNGSRKVICNICGNTLADIYSLKKHKALKHDVSSEPAAEPLKTEPGEGAVNIPIDHQGLIARVRSVLAESPEPSFPDDSALPSESSVIIHQPEAQMFLQHADGTAEPMIIQHADAPGAQMFSGTPMIIQHSDGSAGTPVIFQDGAGTPVIFQDGTGTPMIIQHAQGPDAPVIIQHADGTASPVIIQREEASETPMLIQHGDAAEQVSYVVEQYEIPGASEMEHAQIVIVQTME